jgi:hypothetical protein
VNEKIFKENRECGILKVRDYEANDYLATTACLIVLARHGDHFQGSLGFIGDTVALQVVRNGAALLTYDQLLACHAFSYPHWEGKVARGELSKADAERERLVWQRSHARNRSDARDSLGNLVGFGVLTGEPSAMDFLEVRHIYARPGDRFILASDALRACRMKGERETAASYGVIPDIVRSSAIEAIPGLLIQEIRRAERVHNLRSDDATVVAIEIQ